MLTCFYTDNYKVDGRHMVFVEDEMLNFIDTDVPVLMLHAGKSGASNEHQYRASVHEIRQDLAGLQTVFIREARNKPITPDMPPRTCSQTAFDAPGRVPRKRKT